MAFAFVMLLPFCIRAIDASAMPSPLLTYAPYITSQTDKPVYASVSDNGTMVTISGMIDKTIVPSAPAAKPDHASIWVFNPDGKTLIHTFANLTALPHAIHYSTATYVYNYSRIFDLKNSTLIDQNLLIDGDYEVVAIYNKGWQSFSSFKYDGSVAGTTPENTHYFVMVVNDTQVIPIRYSEVGDLKITSIQFDPSYPILHIGLESTKANSVLIVELPRHVIDSRNENNNETESFKVVGSSGGGAGEVDFAELQSSNPDVRILKFDIPSPGIHGRSIYGTQVMPEFGSPIIALFVMAATIGAGIIYGKVRK